MKEIKHLRNEKEKVDFIYVKDLTLKNEQIKKLKDLLYNENETLQDIIIKQDNKIDTLKNELKLQKIEIKELRELLKNIERGLNLR